MSSDDGPPATRRDDPAVSVTVAVTVADGVMDLPAPAKLNLFLHVVGQRADGYHELQTVFQFVDLADRVRIARRDDTRLRRTAETRGVSESDDLVMRAARLLRDEFGVASGADIEVEKRIPIGAGLGGGSSDAATTLVGLDRLWNVGAGVERLATLALGLGADVPVFVRGHAAWAEGVGECLHPLALEEPWVCPDIASRPCFDRRRLSRARVDTQYAQD